MKILYGVQGTGNGHITRARGMSKHLQAAGIEVDYVFSGRPADKYYAMEVFGDWQCLDGLTFSVVEGQVKPLPTLLNAKPLQLIKDIRELPLEKYDLVISDFEPVTAWAARVRKIECLGIGHQYAFNFRIPKQGDNVFTRSIMRQFAPTTHSIGMHWYHFQQPILPPIVDTWHEALSQNPRSIIVYLPFEDAQQVSKLLREFPDYQFLYYGAFEQEQAVGNLIYKPVCREGFQRDLAACGGVISNAGFELASESISLGKKLLVKPLQGQMEQISNGLALEQLALGRSVKQLSKAALQDWLSAFEAKQVIYPDVAKAIVDWLARGDLSNTEELAAELWNQTDAQGLWTFAPYAPASLQSNFRASPRQV